MAARLVASFSRRHSETVSIRADLELDAGDDRVTVLFGPSGSGKTTILRCLAGLDRPQEGFIRFGMAKDQTDAPARVDALLRGVRLDGIASRLPARLSGGEQQRVTLARALARDPQLVLLDEPLAALDLPLRDPMRRELRHLLRSLDVPSVVVTHDRVDALTLGDRMAVLTGGYVRQVGPVHEVFSRPVDLAVAASVGVETVVPGAIIDTHDGVATVRVGSSQILAAERGGMTGSVFACIRAEDVTLESTERRDVSARNHLTGRVRAIQPEGAFLRVTLDCGFSLSALITRPACEELRLAEHAMVVAAIKATAVHLIPRQID